MVRNLNHDIVISANFHFNCKTYCTCTCLCDDALLNYHNHDKKIIYQKQYPTLVLITLKLAHRWTVWAIIRSYKYQVFADKYRNTGL